MTISDRNTIDFIQVKEANKVVFLIVADHLAWGTGDSDDDKKHMYDLQEKVNDYLGYIESGQLEQDYPGVAGFQSVLQVYGKYDRPPAAAEFYACMRQFLENSGYKLEFVLRD